ncbi:lysophospholipid acyltransferase family protein [Maricaulaceae bacterium EIL42A08]|nr:lysophospholipid acyltransferase family protein [Maricaulaceae bacterium EIL42A08]MCP2678364.1 lysophospholipid acyltransferase family protein [Maricaulaceae bacterium NA33B04]
MSFLQSLGFRAEALGWDAYQGLFRSMSVDRASDTGASLLRALGPKFSVQHIARTNMRIAFPEASDHELDRLLVEMWDNFGRLLGEFPNIHRFDFSDDSDQIETEGLDILRELDAKGQPAVLVGGHFANWEMMPATIVRNMKDCRITYRHANNPIIDKRICDQRRAYGVQILAPKGGSGAKELMAALKQGASVALMNDQKMNDGIAAPFFGREAMTASGPSRMALRYDAPLVPMSIIRKDGARFKITVHEPFEKPAKDDPDAILKLVTKVNQFVEADIRRAPAQWFWVHRRFEKPLYRKDAGSS